jgi:hypothetical protein
MIAGLPPAGDAVTQSDINHTPRQLQVRDAGQGCIHMLLLQRVGGFFRSFYPGSEGGCIGVSRDNGQCRALLSRRT